MSPYIAVSVYGYQPGEVVPDADEAMVAVGAVKLVGEETAQATEGLAEFLGVPAAEDAAPLLDLTDKERENLGALADELESAGLELTAATDLDAMDMKALRKAAKAAGVNSFGKNADALRDELRGVT